MMTGKQDKIQLVCLGFAGSEAAAFHILEPYLRTRNDRPERIPKQEKEQTEGKRFKADILVTPIEYAGRGARSKEAFYADGREMVKDVAEQIKQERLPGIPYAILGYSMGALTAYELFAGNFVAERPQCVFLAAHEPPDVECRGKSIDLSEDSTVLEKMKVYGGVDERLLKNKRFAAIYGARIKEDLRLLQEYRFTGNYYKFPIKTVVMYCEADIPYTQMCGWSRFCEQPPKFYEMGKTHFFFRTNTGEFCDVIKRELGMAE